VLLVILYFYDLVATGKGGTVQMFGNNANESKLCPGRN
jgi:hypothetical protein